MKHAVRRLSTGSADRMDKVLNDVARGSHPGFPWVLSETAHGIRRMQRFEQGETPQKGKNV